MNKSTPQNQNSYLSPLPTNPSLEKQKKLAKSLVKSYCNGKTEATQRINTLHPNAPRPEDFQLSDAQLVIARGYGFASWTSLKDKIDNLTKSPQDHFIISINAGDIERTRQLLNKHPHLVQIINAPLFEFGSTAAIKSRTNIPLLDLLIEHGASINIKSNWPQGPFGILEQVTPDQAEPLIKRGAKIDIWAASHLGFLEELKAQLQENPSLVNAKGGDGKRPLHYARTIEIAEYLLSKDADINALCDDHESTAAQYNLKDNPDLSRYLVAKGCQTDLLMACALNNPELVQHHLNSNPKQLEMRVDEHWFPKSNKNSGGSIYQWVLGFNVTPLQVARSFNSQKSLEILHQYTTTEQKLVDALWTEDQKLIDDLINANEKPITGFTHQSLTQVTDATCNNNTKVAVNMLKIGFPADVPGRFGGNVLHWASYMGNVEILKAALKNNPPLNNRDQSFEGLPTGWLVKGYEDSIDTSSQNHADCLKLLLEAGADYDDWFPTGYEEIDSVFRTFYFN